MTYACHVCSASVEEPDYWHGGTGEIRKNKKGYQYFHWLSLDKVFCSAQCSLTYFNNTKQVSA